MKFMVNCYSVLTHFLYRPQLTFTRVYDVILNKLEINNSLKREIYEVYEVLLQNGLSTSFDIFKGQHRIIQNNTFLMIPFSLYITEYF